MWLWLSAGCLVLAAAGCVYMATAAVLVRRFAGRTTPAPAQWPSVTILKPLHGAEPRLEDNLASFCRQDYPGPVQVVFGVQDAGDPAAAVAARVIEASPGTVLELVVDGRRHGSNGKVSNLINMAKRVRYDVVVLADSDMRVEADYLVRVVSELERPGIGGVTCLYYGIPAGGTWSQLSALAIDTHFLPNVVVGVALGLARPCFGSTIALQRSSLAEIGGFEVLADVLADDYALGEAIRARGEAVAIPSFAIGHVCAEASWSELWRHELRWARTIRIVDPAGFAGLVVTHALPLALIATLAAGFGGGPGSVLAGLALAGVAIACRIALCVRVERAFDLMPHPRRLVLLRDLLSFAVFIASFVSGSVTWKGHDFRVVSNGTLVPDRRSPSP